MRKLFRLHLFCSVCFVIVALLLKTGCENKPEKQDYRSPPAEKPDFPPPVSVPGHESFDQFEDQVLDHLYSVSTEDRPNYLYLNLCGPFNEGKILKPFVSAANKGLNAQSVQRDLASVDISGNCAAAFDQRDFGVTNEQWANIIDHLDFPIKSNTARGALIRQLTGKDFPWVYGDDFLFNSFQAGAYYETIGVPSQLAEFFRIAGVDLQKAFDDVDKDLFMAGKTASPIALQKPRSTVRTESKDGALYATYDTDLNDAANIINGVNVVNLFEAPFPVEARSVLRTHQHNAQEFIWHLPNGLYGWALFNAAGVRQDFAPLTTVVDTESAGRGLDPTIQIFSCHRCHSSGILPFRDEIAAHAKGNPEYNNADVQRAQAFFGKSGFAEAMKQDNAVMCGALQDLGLSCSEPDPINTFTDLYRSEWSKEKLAGFLFLTGQELTDCINASPQGRAQIGQILAGSQVSLEQLKITIPILITDCNLFADDLGE